jgi:uncharacterized OsmC-like protein
MYFTKEDEMEQQVQGTDSGRNVKELNGVNLDRLNETVSNIKADLSLAKFKFRAENHWVNGAYNQIDIKSFYGAGKEWNDRDVRFSIEADSPDVLLGTDKATDPVEYLLGALSSCMTTTIAYHAAAKGITINKLSSTYEGDIDLQGFLGLSDKEKKGFKEIRVNFNVETDAKETELREMIQFSPVYEMISAGVPVKVNFDIKKPTLS